MSRPVAVVVTHNSAQHVDGCFSSLRRAGGGNAFDVVAVDNASSDGTAERIPAWVELVRHQQNLGYGRGCNAGLRLALDRGAEYACVLNPDTEVEPDFLDQLLAAARALPDCGSVQPLLLLGGERGLINSAGNRIHFLGFGSCGAYRRPRAEAPASPVEIPFASGACTLFSCAALRAAGLFDESFFLYQEDLDLGWRLRLAGFRNYLAPGSVVYHHHSFAGGARKRYYLERNRYLALFKNLRWRSLLLLSPLLFAAEAWVLASAAREGWLLEKLQADLALLTPRTWALMLRERRGLVRRLRDRDVAELFDGRMDHPEVQSPLLRAVNPALEGLWHRLRPLLA